PRMLLRGPGGAPDRSGLALGAPQRAALLGAHAAAHPPARSRPAVDRVGAPMGAPVARLGTGGTPLHARAPELAAPTELEARPAAAELHLVLWRGTRLARAVAVRCHPALRS